MKSVFLFVCELLILLVSSEILIASNDFMRFDLNCGEKKYLDLAKNSDLGSENDSKDVIISSKEEVNSVLNTSLLRSSLQEVVGKEEEVNHIISQVERALYRHNSSSDEKKISKSCTNIQIEVPSTQDVGVTEEQIQAVIQQSNYILLEQINTLLAMKLNAMQKEVDELIHNQTREMKEGNDILLEEIKSIIADANEKPFGPTVLITNSSNHNSSEKLSEETPSLEITQEKTRKLSTFPTTSSAKEIKGASQEEITQEKYLKESPLSDDRSKIEEISEEGKDTSKYIRTERKGMSPTSSLLSARIPPTNRQKAGDKSDLKRNISNSELRQKTFLRRRASQYQPKSSLDSSISTGMEQDERGQIPQSDRKLRMQKLRELIFQRRKEILHRKKSG